MTRKKRKEKKAWVLLGHAGRQHGCFPSLVFNTVNNLPCFLVSSEDAMADIHGSRGNQFTWKSSASVYTLLVNIR